MNARRKDLLDSIEGSAKMIASEKNGEQTVSSLLAIHNAECFDELSTAELEDVFSTLFQYEADIKD